MATKLSKAALAGLVGGVAGAFAMSQFSRVWGRVSPQSSGSPQRSRVIEFHAGEAGRGQRPEGDLGMYASQQEWDSTLHATAAVARVLRMPVNDVQRERGAVAVHYAVGAAMGAAYGVAREFLPDTAIGAGTVFGLGVWLVFEEAGMPLLGWTRSPLRYSPAEHANALGEHVAYGITADAVCRLVRRAW